MTEKEFADLLNRYQKGECTEEEERMYHAFFDSYQRNNGQWKTEEWGDKEEIKRNIYGGILRSVIPADKASSGARNSHSYYYLKIAATILVFMIAGGLWYYFQSAQSPAPIQQIVKTTTKGQKLALTLPDGSRVTLNSESSLTYPKSFDGAERRVHLSGEAFFQVHRNPDQPFVIQSGDINTTVLGTTFNVKSYPKENSKVTVVSGKVRVNVVDPHSTQEVMLTANQQVRYIKDADGLVKEEVTNEAGWSWKDGIIYLDNTTIQETARILERWYDVHIEIENPAIASCLISGKYKTKQIYEILESLKFIYGIQYDFTKTGQIKLKGKVC